MSPDLLFTIGLAVDLLQRILVIDPDERISVEDALLHPYLNNYYDSLGGKENPIYPKLSGYLCEKTMSHTDMKGLYIFSINLSLCDFFRKNSRNY